MINRYQFPEVTTIWAFENQVHHWVKLEILITKFWYQEKKISLKAYQQIAKCVPDLNRLQQLEQKTHHQLAAVVQMMEEQAGSAGKWIHYGLTSNDILDTVQNKLLAESLALISRQIKQLEKTLQNLATKHQKLLCLGRTHGQAAEPITYGYKFALWAMEFSDHHRDLILAKTEINRVKLSGPTGMYSHIPLALSTFVAQAWNMQISWFNTQVMNRNHLIRVVHVLTRIGISCEKIAIEIRNLSRSEINELQEGFTMQQKGSSAMPHKKNPITSENITGLMTLLRSLSHSFEATNLLWHERDLSNSAIERVAIPDIFHLLATGLTRLNSVLTNLQFNFSQIAQNLKNHDIAIFSHSILTTLLTDSKISRNEAYQLVQKASHNAIKNQQSFRESLIKMGILTYLSETTMDNIFNLNRFIIPISQLWKHFNPLS